MNISESGILISLMATEYGLQVASVQTLLESVILEPDPG